MLSTGAFNALLKTLEEPPPHVKFFFATTEANKIPITVLSRCQRYDFAGITPEVIATTLGEICAQERVEAEPEALQVVARRAGGSMRDAQSLLDRLLASGSPRLTVEVVHALLGTASDERLLAMLEALADHDSAAALRLARSRAPAEGVQPAELLGGLLDFLRDAMVLAVGAESMLLAVTPRQRPRLEAHRRALAGRLDPGRAADPGGVPGPDARQLCTAGCWSSWPLVRVARLEDLTTLATLVERLAALEAGAPRPVAKARIARKKEPGAGGWPLDAPSRPAPPAGRPTLRLPSTGPEPSVRSRDRGRTAPARMARASRLEPAATVSSGDAAGAGRTDATAAAGPLPTRRRATVAGAPSQPARSPSERPVAAWIWRPLRKVWPDLVKKVGAELGVAAQPGRADRGARSRTSWSSPPSRDTIRWPMSVGLPSPWRRSSRPSAADPPAGDRQVRAVEPTTKASRPMRRQPERAAGGHRWQPTRWSRRSSSSSRPVRSSWITTNQTPDPSSLSEPRASGPDMPFAARIVGSASPSARTPMPSGEKE